MNGVAPSPGRLAGGRYERRRHVRALLKPRKLGGWSENARTKPLRLAARYRRTAKPSPEVSDARCAFRTTMPDTCCPCRRPERRSTTRMRVVTNRQLLSRCMDKRMRQGRCKMQQARRSYGVQPQGEQLHRWAGVNLSRRGRFAIRHDDPQKLRRCRLTQRDRDCFDNILLMPLWAQRTSKSSR